MLNFPEYALKCIQKIEENGFKAYFVGGCVRDQLLGKEINDVDVASSALPEQIMSVFEKSIPTGIKHGTVTVIIDEMPIEITTFRSDGAYLDSRHPDNVIFVDKLSEDLSRRDFTINAMAYNPSEGIVDLFNGMEHLSCATIAAVGDPTLRFTEDALRILRAYRFSSTLNFSIAPETEAAALKCSDYVKNISGERVFSEIFKLANGQNPSVIYKLLEQGSLSFFGIGTPRYNGSYFEELSKFPFSGTNKTAMFIFLTNFNVDCAKQTLHADNDTINSLKAFENFSKDEPALDKTLLKHKLSNLKDEEITLYFEFLAFFHQNHYPVLNEYFDEIQRNLEPFRIKHLAINGDWLLRKGIKGVEIGTMLQKALTHVINFPEQNTVEALSCFLNL